MKIENWKLKIKMDGSWLKTAVFILLILFCVSLFTYQIALPAADDMARHVVNGREILHGNFDVLYKNVYSYTMPDQPFVNHHWLSGVIFYLLLQTVGWGGLVVFKVAIELATFSIVFFLAKKLSNFWLASIFSIPAIIILIERSALRPEIFSYLFIAIFLYVLFKFNETNNAKILWWLIPLQILWVNIHVFFIVGPGLVGGFLLQKIIEERNLRSRAVRALFIVTLLLIIVNVINPNVIKGALYPLNIFNDYGMNVSENNSLDFFMRNNAPWDNISFELFQYSIYLLGASFVLGFRREKKPVFFLLISIATAVGGLVIARLVSSFALFFLPAICYNIAPYFEKIGFKIKFGTKKFAQIFTAVIALVIIFLLSLRISGKIEPDYRLGVGLDPHSRDAGEFMREVGITGPIFNDYDIGSYLVYYMYPKERDFVDNRPEAFTGDFFKKTYLPLIEDENFWQEQNNKLGFNAIIFYRYDEGPLVSDFLYRRVKDGEWSLVYADNYVVIYLRNVEKNKEIIDKYKITPENAQQRFQYLINSGDYEDVVAAADNFNLVGRRELGMETFFNVVYRWPNKGKIWKVMGQWELSNQNPKSPLLSIAYLQKAIDEGYGTAETYFYLGQAYKTVEHYDKAKVAFEKSLKIDPTHYESEELLQQVEEKLNK